MEIKMNGKKNIYKALCDFQAVVPAVEKLRQGYNFTYSDLADIWLVIRKPLTENGLSLTQLVESDENGNNYMTTRLCHISGETIESKMMMVFQAKKLTEVGSAMTYYRRYMLSAMLGIVSDQDVDAKVEKQEQIYEEKKVKKLPNISKEQLKTIDDLINGYSSIRARMVKAYGSLSKIKESDFDTVVTAINKLISDIEASNEKV
jgi:hypothetical protein